MPKSPYLEDRGRHVGQKPRSEDEVRAEENRMAEGAEPFVSCTVLAGNPVSYRGLLYNAGQTVSIRYSAAYRLQAQGRVSIP